MEGLSEYRWPLKGGETFARVAHDDRFDLLVEHEDPKFRMSAVKVIRYLPKPRFMQALPNLIKDSDPEVKAEALKVQDELKEIEEAVLPHRVHQAPKPNRAGQRLAKNEGSGKLVKIASALWFPASTS